MKYHLLLFFTITTISWSDCDMEQKVDFLWQLEMTSSVAGPRRSSKSLPKAKLAPKNGHGHFGDLLPVWSTTVSWVLAKLLHLRSMLSKSMRYNENCNAYSQHLSTEWAQSSMKTPNCIPHDQHIKNWMNWAMKFCLIHCIYLTCLQLTITSSSILTTFCRKNTSTTSRRQNALQEFTDSWSTDFYAIGINKHFSLAKMCWL